MQEVLRQETEEREEEMTGDEGDAISAINEWLAAMSPDKKLLCEHDWEYYTGLIKRDRTCKKCKTREDVDD